MGNKASKARAATSKQEEHDAVAFQHQPIFNNSTSVRNIVIDYKNRRSPTSSVTSNYIYQTNKRKKSHLLIINNTDSGSRKGADLDVRNLRALFKKLNFSITIKNNFRKNELIKCLQSYTKNSKLADCNMCAVIVLGNVVISEDKKITAIGCLDNDYMPAVEIVSCFSKCEFLNGKPKIFLFQGPDTGLRPDNEIDDSREWLKFKDTFVSGVILTGELVKERRISSYFVQALCHVIMTQVCVMDFEEMHKRVEIEVYNYNKTTQHTYYYTHAFKKCYLLNN